MVDGNGRQFESLVYSQASDSYELGMMYQSGKLVETSVLRGNDTVVVGANIYYKFEDDQI